MISRQAMVDEFCELVQIDSLSGKEGRVAEALARKLTDLGLSVHFDNAHEAIKGEVGNLIAYLPATDSSLPTLMLQSHMDTVAPSVGIQPLVSDTYVTSGSDTILGADAKSGVTIILHALREVIAAGIPHGELQVVFCISEETGLLGAYHLDYSKVSPKYCFVFDGGRQPGVMTTCAPSAFKMTYRIKGLASHAGVHPERGISAIQAAAQGIARMKLGRIDFETTANVGVIEGGTARNIIPDSCTLLAEARSHDEDKLKRQMDHMAMCLQHAALESGAELLEPEVHASYRRFFLSDDAPIVQIAWRAAEALGYEPRTEVGGGGSDANVFNERGIPALICPTGGEGAHTLQERLDIDAFVGCARFLVQIISTAR